MMDTSTTSLKNGTVAGTLLIILANITSSDLVRTAVLAGVGATVSFCASFLLRKLGQWWWEREKVRRET